MYLSELPESGESLQFPDLYEHLCFLRKEEMTQDGQQETVNTTPCAYVKTLAQNLLQGNDTSKLLSHPLLL